MKKTKTNIAWIIQITVFTFILTMLFSTLSELVLKNTTILLGFLVIIVFIFIGIIFDMIGVAASSSDIQPFNSMSAKKVEGADVAVLLKKNMDKVSSFCNDVVGDICGIMSGTAGVVVINELSTKLSANIFIVTLLLTSAIAALTIGGKAIGKGFAMKNSTKIIMFFSRFASIFYKQRKNK